MVAIPTAAAVRPSAAPSRPWRAALARRAMPYLFLLPFFALFGLFWLGPIVASFGYSFTEWRGITEPSFVGVANYVNLWFDERFATALFNTLKMAFAYVVTANLLAF